MEENYQAANISEPVEKSSNVKSKRGMMIFSIARVLVSGFLIYWILRNTQLSEIFEAGRKANIWLLIIAFLLHISGFVIGAYRWRLLLRTRGSDASIHFLIKSYIVGVFFNNLLPSTIGGDAYRAYDSYRIGQSRSGAVVVVFLDRFLGLLALIIFALLAILPASELTGNILMLRWWVLLGTAGMATAVLIIFMPPKWLQKVPAFLRRLPMGSKPAALLEALLSFKGKRMVLAKALFYSFLLQANVVIYYYLISQSLQLPIPFVSFFLIIPLATVIMMLPISVNGIGVRENVFIFFVAAFGVLQPQAVAFAGSASGMVVLQGVLGGILYNLRHR